jgi:AcrR family transcriptional regulator
MIDRVSTSVQRSRRREQREQTRREILAAADRFLREHPFRELSVDVVMAQTELTRTAFYRHFDDVTELVMRLLEEVGSELRVIAVRWVEAAAEDFAAAAHEGLAGIVSFFDRNGPLVRAVAEAAATDEEIERRYQRFVDSFVPLIAAGLDGLIERGQLEPCDTRRLARALNFMNERYLLDEFGRGEGDAQAALLTLERVWLRTLGVS